MSLLCIKSLYKSTYKKNAFTKGKRYNIVYADKEFIYVLDEMRHKFNFLENKGSEHYYYFGDYFLN